MFEYSTNIEKCRTQFKWTLKKFGTYLKFYERSAASHNLKSSIFHTEINNKLIEWFIVIKYHGTKSNLKNWLSIYLFCSSAGKQKYYGKFTFDILNKFNRRAQNSKIGEKCEFTDHRSAWGEEEFIETKFLIENAEKLLPGDDFTIICDLVVHGKPILVSQFIPHKKRKRCDVENYQELFDDHKCSDITFVIDHEEFGVHKSILLARSPGFFDRIKENMIGNGENRIKIKDMKAQVFKELLRFIYTNEIKDLDGIIEDLLEAAAKYRLNELKEFCEEDLYQSINVGNVAWTLVLADRYKSWKLKHRVFSFIHKNALDVLETAGFRDIEKSRPYLITELYKSLIIQRTSPQI